MFPNRGAENAVHGANIHPIVRRSIKTRLGRPLHILGIETPCMVVDGGLETAWHWLEAGHSAAFPRHLLLRGWDTSKPACLVRCVQGISVDTAVRSLREIVEIRKRFNAQLRSFAMRQSSSFRKKQPRRFGESTICRTRRIPVYSREWGNAA